MFPVDFKKNKNTGSLRKYNNDRVRFEFHMRSDAGPSNIVATWCNTDQHNAVHVVYSGTAAEDVQWVVDPRCSVIVTVIADFRLIESNVFTMKHTPFPPA